MFFTGENFPRTPNLRFTIYGKNCRGKFLSNSDFLPSRARQGGKREKNFTRFSLIFSHSFFIQVYLHIFFFSDFFIVREKIPKIPKLLVQVRKKRLKIPNIFPLIRGFFLIYKFSPSSFFT